MKIFRHSVTVFLFVVLVQFGLTSVHAAQTDEQRSEGMQ